ncbi:DUF3429 domain-containing protein [Pseudomonas sp. NW5]|uniref:DUF3429 domain-containing protein n=1 Tax=Pseudomonas sp. NW5 TaxID=2934934 RepID=UPI0020208CBD|nr:DUF3429 domain-containing protein [Pseudomonas sp. NW5]MCL7463177.1 DUF3429 domain-containing protein [Pseudomonas sp. NW5]
MHPFTAKRPPQLAWLLGLAGLIPFVSGALGVWVTPAGWRTLVLEALLDYAALILAFMGAIHWGLALRGESGDLRTQLQLGLSVIPPLLGWLAIAFGVPALLAIPLLLLSFVGLYLADLRAIALGLAPVWYARLRLPLTLIVSLSLLVAWAGVWRG